MKYIAWTLGALFALFVLLFVAQLIASERVEVVELHTLDAEGTPQTTRLWVVDHAGSPWLRSGGPEASGWYARVVSNDTVHMTRNGETHEYRPLPDPAQSERINQLMHEKYTWGDELIGMLMGTREGAMAIELQRLP